MKKITHSVVTGAGGFLANALINTLIQKRISVDAVGYRDFTAPETVRTHIRSLDRPDAISDLLTLDTTVFHLGASADVAKSVQDPRHDFNANFLTTFELLESARKTGASVVFPSTASIFDPAEPMPYAETARIKPGSPYGAAKAACESYCFAYHRSYSLDVKVVRLFSVYGIGMKKYFLFDILKKIQANPKELVIGGSGNQIRDYLYVDDCISGLITVAESGSAGEVYHLASGRATKIIELAQLAADAMGAHDIRIVPNHKERTGDTEWYADIHKIKSLGFMPQVSLEEGVSKTVKWIVGR